MSLKYQNLLDNEDTRMIGFLCRVVNFLEDVLEDAECREIYVEQHRLRGKTVEFKAVECKYDVTESARLFSEVHDLRVIEGEGNISLSQLYDYIVDYYSATLHRDLKQYAFKTLESGIEYYLGVLFNGEGFLIEGEVGKVIVPNMPQCLSAHTHPSHHPTPSLRDIKTINQLLVNRGIAHIVETVGRSLAIYRKGPISLDDYEALLNLEKKSDVLKILHETNMIKILKLRYI
ncbi:MAG: hypothetical protein QXG50_04890 [Desulfurococcaceae archaeon]